MDSPSTARTAAGQPRPARVRAGWLFGPQSSTHGLFVIVVVLSSVLFTVLAVISWFTVARDAQLANELDLAHVAGLRMIGYGHQFDLEARELSILWELSWCALNESSLALGATAEVVVCRPFDRAVDIYLNDLSKPVFSYDPQSFPSEALFRDVTCFQTDHRISAGTKRGYTEQLVIPFDRYTLRAFAIAIDPATNNSVYIARFMVASPLGNFVVVSHDIAASELANASDNGRVTPHTESRVLSAEIRRSTIAQIFTLSLALVNWMLTIGTVYVTTLIASGKMEANDAAAALPISMLLTIPGIRALYTESPNLVASLDMAGFFVQLLVIALCELILLRALTRHRPAPLRGGLA